MSKSLLNWVTKLWEQGSGHEEEALIADWIQERQLIMKRVSEAPDDNLS